MKIKDKRIILALVILPIMAIVATILIILAANGNNGFVSDKGQREGSSLIKSSSVPTATGSPSASPTVKPSNLSANSSFKNDCATQVQEQQPTLSMKSGSLSDRIICIDPGHQKNPDYEKEQIAPGSKITKEKMSYGTTGVSTHIPEYRLNLAVGLKLKDALLKYGARIIMTREVDDVKSSNIDRAKLANEAGAELVVRIHADGAAVQSARGISVLYPGKQYITDTKLIDKSRYAAKVLLDAAVEKTGANSRGIVERNDLTGFNWSEVPSVLIEMGFMTNPDEDVKLNSVEYQDKLVEGMVAGILKYFQANNQ